jgi:hypothetical protein
VSDVREDPAGRQNIRVRRRLRAAVDEWTTYEVDEDVDPLEFAREPGEIEYRVVECDSVVDEILDEVECYVNIEGEEVRVTPV